MVRRSPRTNRRPPVRLGFDETTEHAKQRKKKDSRIQDEAAVEKHDHASTSVAQLQLVQLYPFSWERFVLVPGFAALGTHLLCRRSTLPSGAAAFVVILVAFSCFFLSAFRPIPQDKKYHRFADRRGLCMSCGSCSVSGQDVATMKGFFVLPNWQLVLSNVPFWGSGLIGLAALVGQGTVGTPWELRVGWPVFFIGTMLVCIGSSYYHAWPSNATLAWDRLPMTVAFMSVFALVIEERLGSDVPGLGEACLPPFILAGAASVWYWTVTDDLRPYILVQFVPLLTIPILVLSFDDAYTHANHQLIALLWYAIAKVLEALDVQVYKWSNHRVSGHTLKHLAAAIGPLWLAWLIAVRRHIS